MLAMLPGYATMQVVLYAGSLTNVDMLTGWLCRQFVWLAIVDIVAGCQ
jgi:hypothetical protein